VQTVEPVAWVFEDARVLDPATSRDEVADVVVESGYITRIGHGVGRDITGERVKRIPAKGSWLVPGLMDMHVHFREPGQEYKEEISTGLAAAAAGGFVSVCAMPNTSPVNDTRAITEAMIASAARGNGARLLPVAAITMGLRGEVLTEMGQLREAGAVAVSDDGKCVMNAAVMRRALEYARTYDLLVSQHAEDHNLTQGALAHEGQVAFKLGLRGWPRVAEDIIVARDLLLTEVCKTRYHVAHISSFGAVRLLREAKSRGLKVSAEVTPHHLVFSDEALLTYQTFCKVNPPLRTHEDVQALRDALNDGTIDCIATDHAPHAAYEKDCSFQDAAWGMIGLETTLPALLTLVRQQKLNLMRMLDALTSAPSRIVLGEAVSVREGARADLTVIDPQLKWRVTPAALKSKSHNTPFLNQELMGAVTMTMINGQAVFQR